MRLLHPVPGAVFLVVFLLIPSLILSSTPPARGDSGGPDAYGYTWVDNKAPNPGIAYSWIDGVTGGRDLLLDDENCTEPSGIPFGFPFRFYGILYNSAYVCANGFIAFGFPAGYASETDDFAAAFDADLDPNATGGGHVFVRTDSLSSPRRFIVTWNNVFLYGTTDPQKFEIVLTENPTGEDGRILFQYASLVNPLVDHPPWIKNLGDTSHLDYPSPLENSLAVMFLPPGTSPPGDVLTAQGASLAPATIEPGQRDVAMLRLNLTTQTNSVNLRRVRVDLTGVTSQPGDVSKITLWRDADRDRQFNTSLDIPLVSSVPSGSPEAVLLTLPAPLPIVAGTGEDFFVAFDLPFTAVPGDRIGAGVLGASYLTVDPPDNVSSANLPINTYDGTRTLIIEGVDTLRVVSSLVANPVNVTQWQTDVPMFATTFDVDKGIVTMIQVNVTFNGTSPSDVSLVKLSEDTNRDLVLQPGADRLLAKGRFDATGNLGLPVSLVFNSGSPRTLWVSYDIAPNAVVDDTVGARIVSPSAVTVAGTKDRVDPANFPVENPSPSTISAGLPPSIDSVWAVRTPVPDGFLMAGEYVLSSRNSKDLFAIGGNTVASWLIIENDADYLYVVYDAVGDSTAGANDTASIAFQTNRTTFPLAPADDEFGVGDPMGPFHAIWNDTSLAWRIEDACSAGVDANHTGLACTIGYGQSPLRPAAHRVYEFRIPLRLLEVPIPIPVGYSLGFAGESNWSEGVEERNFGGNASWPFADPGIPPVWYGVLKLIDAPPPNRVPVLDWTGEPGFVGRGLNPDSGTTSDTYEYRISYQDADSDFPSLSEPRLHVLQGVSEIAGSPFAMGELDPSDTDVIDGKSYVAFLSFSDCPETFSYFFTATDERGAIATPTAVLTGPMVTCPPIPPELSNDTVSPAQGFANATNFTWSVEYRDAEGSAPARIQVTISKGGSPLVVLPLGLQTWLGGVDDYTAGAVYAISRNLSSPGTDYSFSFLADDGVLQTTTPPAAGPIVDPEPVDQLRVTFSDDTPLSVDAGRRNVSMFTAFLQASANSVSLTSLQIDRAGGVDSDVDAVRVYHDADGNGVPGPADTLLGQGAFLGGTVRFSGFLLQVTAGQTKRLIALIDIAPNAVADARVGLGVVDDAYLEVAPPDTVAPFATFVSGRIPINRAAVATGLTAGKAADSTPAVLHLTDPTPVLGWTFSDPNFNGVQGAYNVSVSAEASGTLLWYENASGTTNSRAYGGSALQDGASYRMDVRVFDGSLWGPTSSLQFRLNTPPGVPVLTNPDDLAGDQGPVTVTLLWEAPTDAEGDPLIYRWSLATQADFVGARTGTTLPGITSASVPTTGGTRYYWRIEAYDEFEWSSPSPTWSFVTRSTVGEVKGRVVHAGGGLLAVVRLYNTTGDLVRQVTTNADGTFDIIGLPFDVYEVRVTSPTYQERALSGVTLSSAAPIQDLGDIELYSTALEVSTMATWAILVAGIVVAITAAGLVLRRRRRESPAVDEPLEGSSPPAQIASTPEPRSAREQLVFECPACGTQVDANAKTCPGCGAIFE